MNKLTIFALSAATAVTMSGLSPVNAEAAVWKEGNAVVITGSSLEELREQFEKFCNKNGPIDWETFLNSICQNGKPVLSTPPTPDVPETEAPDVPETEQPDIPETEQPDVPETEKPDIPETEQPDVPETERPDVPETEQPETPAPPTPEVPDTETPDGETGTASTIQRVVDLVNEERAKEGLAPLSIHASAQAAAAVRAKEIKTSFSHTRPDGHNFSTALTEQGVSYRGAGENIAYGQRTPEQVMEAWMNSSGHRANIMNASYTSIGVGHYIDEAGVSYWTQLFLY